MIEIHEETEVCWLWGRQERMRPNSMISSSLLRPRYNSQRGPHAEALSQVLGLWSQTIRVYYSSTGEAIELLEVYINSCRVVRTETATLRPPCPCVPVSSVSDTPEQVEGPYKNPISVGGPGSDPPDEMMVY